MRNDSMIEMANYGPAVREAEVWSYCDICGEPIYEGDYYYEFDGDGVYCENCVRHKCAGE